MNAADKFAMLFFVAVVAEVLLTLLHILPVLPWYDYAIIAGNLFLFGGISYHIGGEAALEEELSSGNVFSGHMVCDICGPVKLVEVNGLWVCEACVKRAAQFINTLPTEVEGST